MIGETIAHYKILEKLGEGGMGVVYKAEDTKLRRTVALKFLPPELARDEEAKKRFIREAQAAAALDHSNICTIYEVNESDCQTYIAMAYVEGESLKQFIKRGPLELGKALGIATQAAEGLKAAHAKGIIHRDIKSANVMLTPEEQAIIMDFGLAKMAEATRMTKTGTTLGTAAYMCPEQVLGKAEDQRSDIWSLGVVLYEMLMGKLPFRGDYDPALMYAIVHEEPEPLAGIDPELPIEVERVVNKMLTKDPEKRYQSAGELIDDLEELRESLDLLPKRSRLQLMLLRQRRRIISGAVAAAVVIAALAAGYWYFSGRASGIDSIAVLPLEIISGDPEREYFADGITRELTATLGQISAWRVISSRSMMRYKETDKSLSDIAAEVNVKVLLSASIKLLSGDRVETFVELIDGATEKLLWGQPFESKLGDFNNLWNDIARTASERVGIELTQSEDTRLASARPVDPEAYDLYLWGRYHLDKWTKEGIEKAIEYFQQAIEIDPNYAQAHAMLASSYVGLRLFGGLSLEESRSRADPHLRKALEIDDTLPEGHYIVAMSKHYSDWDWVGAEMGYKRALELDPSFVDAHFDYACLLMTMGRSAEAITEAKRALQLDPFSFTPNNILGQLYIVSRQYDQAIEQWQQMIEMEPNNPGPHGWLAYIHENVGRYEDAVRARQKSWILRGSPPEKVAAWVAEVDSVYSESGPEGYWMWRLEGLKGRYDRWPTHAAKYYAQLGDKDQALALLEKAYEKHDMGMIMIKLESCWDPLRDDPRFQDLLRRMNFPENEAQE